MTKTDSIRAFCAKHGITVRCLLALARWAATEDGRRFAEGAPLTPMSDGRKAGDRDSLV